MCQSYSVKPATVLRFAPRLRPKSVRQEFCEGLTHENELSAVRVLIQMFVERTELSLESSIELSVIGTKPDFSPRLFIQKSMKVMRPVLEN